MTVVFEQVLLLILFAAVGYALCGFKLADSKHTKLLSTMEIYVFLPCTVYNTFSKNFTPEYLTQKYILLIASAVILIILVAVAHFGAKLLTKDDYRRKIYAYSLTVPNYGYMGYALAGALFGTEGLLNIMVFSLPVSMYVYTVAYCMLTKTKLNLKRLANPILLSMLVGMVVGLLQVKTPSVLATLAEKGAACMAPVSMLLAGMVISEYHVLPLLKNGANYLVAGLRLVVLPCAISGILRLVGLEDVVIPALTLYCMPCGLNTVVFPKLIGEDCKTGASLAVISSLASCLTIPLCVWLFT